MMDRQDKQDKPEEYVIRGSVDLQEAFRDIPPGSRLVSITWPPKPEVVKLGRLDESAEIPQGKIVAVRLVDRASGREITVI